jgi:hypothetical protein
MAMAGRFHVAGLCVLSLCGGCAAPGRVPDLGGLYDRAAMQEAPPRNPVIVIPGILGSRLVDEPSGRLVWGAFAGEYANPEAPDGARLVALPMRPGASLAELRDEVRPDGALDRLKVDFLWLPIELDAYIGILGTLGVGGYRDELLGKAGAVDYGDAHYTCFQFDYDWRRDVVENAMRLDEFIREKREYIQAETGHAPRFDIVAHSMGGLIARYYLQYGTADLPEDGAPPALTWAGAALVERAILVGTPSAGSVKALDELAEGADFAPILPRYEAAILGTMPAVYQLLPRPRHARVVDGTGAAIDVYDPSVWERYGWGLADPRQDRVLEVLLPDVPDPAARRAVALDHLAKCLDRARRLAAALDAPAARPAGLDVMLFAGDAVPTDGVLAVEDRGRLAVAAREPGDGTVTRASALLDERLAGAWSPRVVSAVDWSSVTFLFTDHLGLTRDPAFTDNVLYLLLEDARRHGPPGAPEGPAHYRGSGTWRRSPRRASSVPSARLSWIRASR